MAPPPSTGDQFIWVGPISGSWNMAANWYDVTTGNNPAFVPPGTDDSVTFNSPNNQYQVISGVGSAASLTFNGENLVTGQLMVGTLGIGFYTDGFEIGATGSITAGSANIGYSTILAGGVLHVTGALLARTLVAGVGSDVTAGSLSISNNLALTGADLTVAGTLTFSNGFGVTLENGSAVQVGSLVVQGMVEINSTSSFEVGTLGGATLGALTVDAGASVSFADYGYVPSRLVDNGTITVSTGDFAAAMSGTGTLVVLTGGNITVSSVIGTGFTIQLQRDATVDVAAEAGNTITLAGNDVISLGAGPSFMHATIGGFDASDALTVAGPITAATYASGTLTLFNGSTAVGMIALAGDYTGDNFVVVPISTTVNEIALAAPPAPGPSPGTATSDQYVWIGPTSGDWNTAANWLDVTTSANPASIAPGVHDIVTINGSGSLYQIISGTGNAASLTFNGNNIVIGDLSVGTVAGTFTIGDTGRIAATTASVSIVALLPGGELNVSGLLNAGNLTAGAGAAITAGSATINMLQLDGASLAVSGALRFSGLGQVSDGAILQAGSLSLSALTVDTGASVEVGSAGGAASGVVTVDPGATLSLDVGATVLSDIVDNGTIVTDGGHTASLGAVTGTGTIVIASYETVRLPSATIGITVSFQPGGVHETLAVTTPSAMAAQIASFGPTDLIDLIGLAYATGATATLSGTSLSVSSGGITDYFTLLGLTPGTEFTATQDGSGGILVAEVACFCPGTLIRTDRGPVAVEALAVGDIVVTAGGETDAVRWIGRRAYAGLFVADNPFLLPVCIKADALADGVPSQDLWVSPGHAMFVDGQLIPAWRLLNGVSIVQLERVETVTYYHVELYRHAVLLANGAPAESFLDDGCRGQFHNAAEFHARYPDATTVAPLAPRLEDGFALQFVQERLALRAGVFPAAEPIGGLRGFVDQVTPGRITGWAQDVDTPEEPVALEICTDGTGRLCVLANAYRADLRAGGMGSGCHAFDVVLDPPCDGPVTVHRIADGALLPLTEAAAGMRLAA